MDNLLAVRSQVGMSLAFPYRNYFRVEAIRWPSPGNCSGRVFGPRGS
jgi:hypothetical protein